MNNTEATTTTINNITYTNAKRGHGAAIHLADENGLTLCNGYRATASRVVGKTANCKTCLKAASLYRG